MNIIVGIATLVVAAALIMPNAFAEDEPEEVVEVTVEEATVEAPAEAKTEDEAADEAQLSDHLCM